jgi:hypothetical protein
MFFSQTQLQLHNLLRQKYTSLTHSFKVSSGILKLLMLTQLSTLSHMATLWSSLISITDGPIEVLKQLHRASPCTTKMSSAQSILSRLNMLNYSKKSLKRQSLPMEIL